MLLQNIIDAGILCAVGAVVCNWAVFLSLLGLLVSGNGSRIQPPRRASWDSDVKIIGLMAGVGVTLAAGVFFGLRGAVEPEAMQWIVTLVSGGLGIAIPLVYARKLNTYYLRRAERLIGEGDIKGAMEDLSEVERSSEAFAAEVTYFRAACYCRFGELERVEQILLGEGYGQAELPEIVRTLMNDYPTMDPVAINQATTQLPSSTRTRASALDQEPELEFNHLRSAQPRENYELSGRVSWHRFIFAAAAGSMVAAVIGAVYAYVVIVSPSVKLNFALTILSGMILGLVGWQTVRLGHVRNRNLACVIGGMIGAVALYSAWSTHFLYFLNFFADQAEAGGGIVIAAPTPIALLEWAGWLMKNGLWAVGGGAALTGWSLVGCWTLEAACLIGIASVVVYPNIKNKMYCESCRCWMQHDDTSVLLPTRRSDEAIHRIKEGDLGAIIRLGIDKEQRDRLSMKMCVCPKCDQTRCLEINETVQTVVNGRVSDVENRIVGPLPINGEEERELRALSLQLMELTSELANARYTDKSSASYAAT